VIGGCQQLWLLGQRALTQVKRNIHLTPLGDMLWQPQRLDFMGPTDDSSELQWRLLLTLLKGSMKVR